MEECVCVCLLSCIHECVGAPSLSDSYPYVSSLVCAFFMFLTPLWIVISSKHPASRTLLYSGWEPVITAMVISRCVCVCVFVFQRKKQLLAVLGCPCLVGLLTHPRNTQVQVFLSLQAC